MCTDYNFQNLIYSRSFHKNIKYECTPCKKFFDSKENLELHKKTTEHSSNSTEENIETQKSPERLQVHNAEQVSFTATSEITKDDSSKVYTCNKCDKQFELKQEYELHEKMVHDPQKFSCSICNKNFTNQSNLKVHMAMHKVCFTLFKIK